MKHKAHKNLNKKLSIINLVKVVRTELAKIKSERQLKKVLPTKISLQDCLVSAFAMFSIKAPSLLSFDNAAKDEILSNNLRNLYKIRHVPSDTYMREKLDVINPEAINSVYKAVFKTVQKAKLLESYSFLDNSHLLTCDGTQIFSSNKVFCENCCEKKHRDGKITYHHNIVVGAVVSPEKKQVLPLFPPEAVVKQDGNSKNDCEQNAFKRFLKRVKKEHPKMNFTIVYDALIANTPTINFIISLDYNFIINVKPSSNKVLFDWINGLELNKVEIKSGKNTYKFRYINQIPLNDNPDAPEVNFLECVAEEIKGRQVKTTTFTWVTLHTINKKTIFEIMRGGRARWKVENETINTLKNQGYQLEHNFGHGYLYLSTIFALLMILAFLVDQTQEAACGVFQEAIKSKYCRRAFWEKLRVIFYGFLVDSWEDLFRALISMPKIKLFFNST